MKNNNTASYQYHSFTLLKSMFHQLFRLCRRSPLDKISSSGKTPIEDFITYSFAGLLNDNKDLKEHFLYSTLKLPKLCYTIYSQRKYDLEGGKYCKIDLVFENTEEKIICFVENKVDSKEGEDQLKRYAKILDSFEYKEYDTYLVYCTKNYDPKQLKSHSFNYIRWYDIADILNNYPNKFLICQFYNFLKSNKMAQKHTLNNSDVATMRNMASTLEFLNECLDQAKPIFTKKFKPPNKVELNRQLRDWNRWIYSIKRIVDESDSDMNYGFYFDEPRIYVGMYFGYSDKPYYNSIYSKASKMSDEFSYVSNDDDKIIIYREKFISNLADNPKAISEIKEWFKESFEIFENFIVSSKHEIPWKV